MAVTLDNLNWSESLVNQLQCSSMADFKLVAESMEECRDEVSHVRNYVQYLDNKIEWSANKLLEMSSAKIHTDLMIESLESSGSATSGNVKLLHKEIVAMKKDMAKLTRDMAKVVKLLEAGAAAKPKTSKSSEQAEKR